MPNFICATCGTQFAGSGQQWTTLDNLRESHRLVVRLEEGGGEAVSEAVHRGDLRWLKHFHSQVYCHSQRGMWDAVRSWEGARIDRLAQSTRSHRQTNARSCWRQNQQDDEIRAAFTSLPQFRNPSGRLRSWTAVSFVSDNWQGASTSRTTMCVAESLFEYSVEMPRAAVLAIRRLVGRSI